MVALEEVAWNSSLFVGNSLNMAAESNPYDLFMNYISSPEPYIIAIGVTFGTLLVRKFGNKVLDAAERAALTYGSRK